jgi:angio-associated migratory cell protein
MQVFLFLFKGTRAVVGYEDGSVRIFDLRTCKSIFHTPPDNDPIKSMDCHRDNTLVLAGSAIGEAKIINTRNGKVGIKINNKLKTLKFGSSGTREVALY